MKQFLDSRMIAILFVMLIGVLFLAKGGAIGSGLQSAKNYLPALEVPAIPPQSSILNNMQTGKVELDIFSTKANPTWAFSQNDLKMLQKMLDNLPSTTPFEFADNLGYRGFIIEVPNSGSDRTVLIKIYQDKIQYDMEGKTKFLLDRDRRVESWLLVNAKPYLPASLYTNIETQIQNTK